MRKPITVGVIAAFMGGVIINLGYLAAVQFVPDMQSGWDATASIFLNPLFRGTAIWFFIGIVGQLVIAIANALVVVLVLQLTGYDHYLIKGAIVGLLWWFIVMPLMVVTGFNLYVYNHPPTMVLGLVSILIFNLIVAWLVGRLTRQTKTS